MNGKYRGPDLPRNRVGNRTIELLDRIDSPDNAIYAMQRAAKICNDPEALKAAGITPDEPVDMFSFAKFIRSGKTQMVPETAESGKYQQ